MKEILIIRHAKSSWDDLNLTDFDRPLNNRGKRVLPQMIEWTKEKLFIPELFISSPAMRAKTTAMGFQSLNPSATLDLNMDLYNGYVDDYLQAIKDADNQWNCLAIFGHNPMITSLANKFTDDYLSNVPTCGVIHVRQSLDSWKDFEYNEESMEGYYFPKEIL